MANTRSTVRRGDRVTVTTFEVELTQAMEVNASGQTIYIGKAAPGTAKGSLGWQIQKLTYDANGFVTDVQWADGTAEFDKEWDERATYAYS